MLAVGAGALRDVMSDAGAMVAVAAAVAVAAIAVAAALLLQYALQLTSTVQQLLSLLA
jgi:hypothetical protein